MARIKHAVRTERLIRLLKLGPSIPKHHNIDPWDVTLTKEEREAMASWPTHAPKLRALLIDELVEYSKCTPYHAEAAHARRILCDDELWAPARTTTNVPKSRVPMRVATDLVASDILAETSEQPLAWGLLNLKPEPDKEPPRNRVISDMLWTNWGLPDTFIVNFSTMQQLEALFARNAWARAFDYTGWFYSLTVGERVQLFLAVRIGNRTFVHTRAPMGHKWIVFVAHTFAKVLAWTPHIEHDVIIDNVLYASNNKELLQTEGDAFLARSDKFCATVGEKTEPTTHVTYRGIDAHMGTSIGVKPKWAAKCVKRITVVLDETPNAAQMYSLGGMFAWLRGILQSTTLDDYWLWRTIAKAAGLDQRVRIHLDANTREALMAIRDLMTGPDLPRRDISAQQARAPALLVTDAMQNKPLGRWGAIVVTNTIRTYGGLFPIPFANASSIADLETATVLLALELDNGLHGRDIHLYTDNMVTWRVLQKKRSSAWRLHTLSKKIHLKVRALDATLAVTWIPSAENPADGTSRGKVATDSDSALLRRLGQKTGMVTEGKALPSHFTVIDVAICNEIINLCLHREKQRC